MSEWKMDTTDADAVLAEMGITVSDATREQIQRRFNDVNYQGYLRGIAHNPESGIAIHPHYVWGSVRLAGTRMTVEPAYTLVADPAYRTKGDQWLFDYLLKNWDAYTPQNVLLCCWYAAAHGPHKYRRAWKQWLKSGAWGSEDGALPPPIDSRNPAGARPKLHVKKEKAS